MDVQELDSLGSAKPRESCGLNLTSNWTCSPVLIKWTIVHLPLPSIAHILAALQNSYNMLQPFEHILHSIPDCPTWVLDAWICLAQKMQIQNQSENGSLWPCLLQYLSIIPQNPSNADYCNLSNSSYWAEVEIVRLSGNFARSSFWCWDLR